jgi:hypothetical protein
VLGRRRAARPDSDPCSALTGRARARSAPDARVLYHDLYFTSRSTRKLPVPIPRMDVSAALTLQVRAAQLALGVVVLAGAHCVLHAAI